MRIRKVVALIVVAGALATAQSASAGPLLLGSGLLPLSPAVSSVVALAPVNPLSAACPQVPGTSSYRCDVTVAPGTTLYCEHGYTGNYYGSLRRTGCGITSLALTVFCGYSVTSGIYGASSQDGCSGVIGTTALSVGCAGLSGLYTGESRTCALGPVSYTETDDRNRVPPGGYTQTLAIGNIKYSCINDVCALTTS